MNKVVLMMMVLMIAFVFGCEQPSEREAPQEPIDADDLDEDLDDIEEDLALDDFDELDEELNDLDDLDY